MEKKICSKCGEEKELSEFRFHKTTNSYRCECKICEKKYKTEYNKNYWLKNKNKLQENNKLYRINNMDKINENKKKYYNKHKEKILTKVKKRYENNKEQINKRKKEYVSKNKEKIKNQRTQYQRKNHSTVLGKLKHNIRQSIRRSLESKSYKKKLSSEIILGCTIQDFKKYLESKFEPWMNWDNKGLYNGSFNFGWDIDHIICLDSADTEEEIIKLNHYKNLQPLCSKINRDIKRNNLWY